MIGQTRTTKDGIEKCIAERDGVLSWAMISPNAEFLERNRIDAEKSDKEERKIRLMLQIKSLEEGYNYSMMDGEIEWANQKKAQRLLLKEELRAL